MDKQKLSNFFRKAHIYVLKKHPKDFKRERNTSLATFRRMNPQKFLYSYAWARYGTAFNIKSLGKKFPAIKKAFHNFNIDEICKMKSLNHVLSVFAHKQKAKDVLEGARIINKEGFDNFKKRLLDLKNKGGDVLEELDKLPGIGFANRNLLAKDTGLQSAPKPDVWIKRLVMVFSAEDYLQMVDYLAKKFKEKPGVIDGVLWWFCRDKAWKYYGHETLEIFARKV